MYKQVFTTLLLGCMLMKAQALPTDDRIILKNGSVLVYDVKEGNKRYTYTVTYNVLANGKTELSWVTNEKPKPRKGVTVLEKYFNVSTDVLLVGSLQPGREELNDNTARLFIPATLSDWLIEAEEDGTVTFTVREGGDDFTAMMEEIVSDVYLPIKVMYNGKMVETDYSYVKMPKSSIEFKAIQNYDNYDYFISSYRSLNLSMELRSIKTPLTPLPPKKTTEEVNKTKSTLTTPAPMPAKMDATKLKAVKSAFPLLATLESYDVTNGGKDPKPFSETYDFRLSSGSPNPPSAIDCFTADLKIIYNQKKNYGLENELEVLGKNSLPKSLASAIMGVYIRLEATKVPGYKPYTHHKFVRSLSEDQRQQLAKELEGYIRQYGFTE